MNDPLPFSLPGVFSTVAATSSESRRHSFIRTVSSWPSCGQSGAAGATVYLARPVATGELTKCIEQTRLNSKPQQETCLRRS